MSTTASNFPVQLVHHRHQNHHQYSIPDHTNSSNLLFDYVDGVLILRSPRYDNVRLHRPSYENRGIQQPSNIRSSPSYDRRRRLMHEVGNFIDQHRSMGLDLDHMSYEEILQLEERIGTVRTGLSEENISSCLKTRFHLASATSSSVNDSAAENETCIICQAEYEMHEKIGTLNCGHEYHASCIKQWLLLNNICPICRRPALTRRLD